MPKITEAQRETRRQQILDAALRCFSRDGFHNTTTADIVRESGVSQGTLYLYFTTKDDIVVALGEDRHQREALLSAIAQAEQDPVQGLIAFIEMHGRGLTDPARIDGRRVGVQGWAEALRNPRIRDSVVGGLVQVREVLARLIARGQDAGQIRPEIEPQAMAQVLIAVYEGLVLQDAWGQAIELSEVGRVMRAMIAGLLTPAGRASAAEPPIA